MKKRKIGYRFYEYKDENNKVHDSGYVISSDNGIFIDRLIAREFNIPYQKYVELLKNCGAVKAINDNNYIFKKEDRAIKAVIVLKMII